MYMPELFDVGTIEEAAAIILTPESGMSTAERWKRETPYFIDLIQRWLPPAPMKIVDYGCGIGRLSLPLVKAGYDVIGVDNSPTMRSLAVDYVGSDRFTVVNSDEFERDYGGVPAIFAVWALQHVLDIEATLQSLVTALGTGGLLIVIGSRDRCVPMRSGWANDGFDIPARLSELLAPVFGSNLNPAKVGDATAGRS